MTNTSKYFFTYVSYLNNKKIITANSSFNILIGKNNIKLSSTFVQKNVLHVPKLCTSFVSVNKLPQYLNCKIIFDFSHYDF